MECGQVLSEVSKDGVQYIYERFRQILQDGEIDKKVQYMVEKLFEVRKSKFKEYPGVIPELDLVEDQDKITHKISLNDELDAQDGENLFKFDKEFEKNEEEWEQIKKEILGEEAERINNEKGLIREEDEEEPAD